MKKTIFLLLWVFVVILTASSQINLDSGLVAYFPFNGNANDSSIYHNNGTVYNATLTTDRFGVTNAAYSFNGTSAYIKASANALPSTIRSVSLWFYANNVTNHPVLMGYGGNGNCADGTSFMMVLNIGTSTNKYSTISHCSIKDVLAPYTTAPINQWIHWVVVASNTSTKFYINGVLYKDSAVVYNNTYVPSTNLAFGTGVGWNGLAPFSDANLGYLNGKLDDIRVYNRILSQTEITTLYLGTPAAPTLLSPANGSSNVTLTPTLFWNTVPGATSYRVQVSPTNTFSYIIDSATLTTNQRTIPAGKLNIATTYYWRVCGINQNGIGPWSSVWNFFTVITNIRKLEAESPSVLRLYQNYPNPFNPYTNIKIDIPENAITKITIYDIMGRETETVLNQYLARGTYLLRWEGINYSSGIYYYKITTEKYSDIKKMLLIK